MKFIRGFLMAWGNFTILPGHTKKWDEDARKHMLFALPFVGLVIGALWCGLYLLLNMTALHPAMKAAVMTAYPFIVSGGIHLDGFMDCNDAILSRRPMEDKRRILKDSNVGAFAVISVCLMFLMFFASMWAIVESGEQYTGFAFFFIPMMSRWAAAMDIIKYKPLSTSQYQNVSRKGEMGFIVAYLVTIFAIIIGTIYFGGFDTFGKPYILNSFVAAVCAGSFAGHFARKQLGGMNGDIAGYIIVWGELAAMIMMGVALSWT